MTRFSPRIRRAVGRPLTARPENQGSMGWGLGSIVMPTGATMAPPWLDRSEATGLRAQGFLPVHWAGGEWVGRGSWGGGRGSDLSGAVGE